MPHLLSLRLLDLQNMKSKLYNPHELPRIFGIDERFLYNVVFEFWEEKDRLKTILETLKKCLNRNEKFVLFKGILWCLDDFQNLPVECIYSDDWKDDSEENNENENTIGKNNDPDSEDCENECKIINAENVPPPLFSGDDALPPSSDNKIAVTHKDDHADLSETDFIALIENECIRLNGWYDHFTPCGPLEKWHLIIRVSEELYKEGKMNRRINFLLVCQTFWNDSILEDFQEELPNSSLLYIPLRKRLYGILFHEAEKKFGGTIREFLILDKGWVKKEIAPKELESNIVMFHPGLLTLWNDKNISDDAITQKWKLFCGSISLHLDMNLLRSLPPTLVVPTVVLFYLCHFVPQLNRRGTEHLDNRVKIMETWEAEVFIAQAMMLQKDSVRNSVSKIVIKEYNVRVMKLIAVFAYGCQMVQYYLEVCGNPINKRDVCLLHFFDGYLYQSIYKKALWRRRADIFCDKDELQTFQKIKKIISPCRLPVGDEYRDLINPE